MEPADAIPLTDLEGKGGVLRDDWLKHVTSGGVAPRRGAVRKLAYALAYHANNHTFQVFVGVDTLAHRIAIGENALRNAFRWLVENGWLILLEPGGGRGRPNVHVLSIPASWFEGGDVT